MTRGGLGARRGWRRPSRVGPGVWGLATLLLAACCGQLPEEAVPRPDLEGVETPVLRAVETARRAVRRAPGSAEAWGRLADRLYAHDWHAEAAACYAKAVELDAQRFEWVYRLGRSLGRLDRTEDAIAAFERALLLRDDYPPARLSLAEALMRLGRVAEAREHYLWVVERHPENAHALLGLGHLDLREGKQQQALRRLQQALRRNPRLAEVHQALARVYLAIGDEERAATHAASTRTLPKHTPRADPLGTPRLEPVGSQAHNRRGTELERVGRVAEAEAEFRESLRIKPEYTEARYNLGTVLARTGRLDEAVTHLTEVVRVRPNHAEARLNLGLALSQLGRTAEAEQQFRAAVDANPQHGRARIALARTLVDRGRAREARDHYREAMRLDPSWMEPPRQLAWLLATSRDAELRDGLEALTLAERAGRLAGGPHPATLDALAAAYAETGRYTEAAFYARQGIEAARSAGQSALVPALEARLRLYEQGRPYRE